MDISGTISPTILEWIRKLVAFDTTSRRSNLALFELIRAEMASHALSPLVVSNTEGTKANLFVTIPAIDGTSAEGVMLAGHTDVVPVDGQVWSSDPFIAHIRDGKLYGRGACDMKAFIGVILAMLPAFLSARLLTVASGLHLRRRGRMSWSRRSPRTTRGAKYPSGTLHRGRADEYAGSDGAQEQPPIPSDRDRGRLPLIEYPRWRQRHRVRGEGNLVHPLNRR